MKVFEETFGMNELLKTVDQMHNKLKVSQLPSTLTFDNFSWMNMTLLPESTYSTIMT